MLRKFIGLMSGTSCDGVDAALIESWGSGLDMKIRYLERCSVPYTERLRQELLQVMAPAKTRTETIAMLNFAVGYAFAACARELLHKTGVRPVDITAIGSHGQTICHYPNSSQYEQTATLQIGEPAVIAAQTEIPVVANFRPADMAVGGQGAPLVPWTDYVLFHSDQTVRCVQNIGGIANLTLLPRESGPETVVAFDTGPGCMVVDELVRRASKGRFQFDPSGRFAQKGHADPDSVDQMMQLPYFLQSPPKSAGREQFGRRFVTSMTQFMSNRIMGKYDMIATATLLTARSIAHAYQFHLEKDQQPHEVILTGGGANNRFLVDMLRKELPEVKFTMVDELGIPAQAKECVSFAMLAAACLDQVPANLPQVTGATKQVVLGQVVRL
ncbi:MAG: Anhydro-N-acetylmuramic acid kinase [Phycisphaerae bacterium]|nr:Anhydro-N-acetylmuramic acid kinase [Phycisphaerae bacterium]